MKKKRKKDEELTEIEKEIEEIIEPDSIEQFTEEEKETICRYIG